MAAETSDSNFEKDVLNSKTPVLVDFWAEWCGPCKQLAPVLEELSKDKGDQIKVMKVNIDHNPETPTQYGIRGIPTMIVFKDGKPIATKVGSIPKTSLYSWVQEVLDAA